MNCGFLWAMPDVCMGRLNLESAIIVDFYPDAVRWS